MSSGLLVGKNRRVHLPNSGDAPHVKSCDFFLDVQFQYVRHKFQKIEQCSNLENLNFKKWSGYMNSVSRKERERRERINYVLNVAEGLFAEKGFVKVTMRQIAQKAEFALGTIYSFFKGKQHIYDQLLEKKSEQYISFVKSQIESETNPRKQVEKYIEAKLTYLRNNMSFLRLYFAEIHTPHLATAQGLRIKVKEKYKFPPKTENPVDISLDDFKTILKKSSIGFILRKFLTCLNFSSTSFFGSFPSG